MKEFDHVRYKISKEMQNLVKDPTDMDIDRWQFVGTVNLHDGRLMFHVYVRLTRR